MIDIKTYTDQKTAGLATLVKTDTVEAPSFTLVKKNWNPDTGEQALDTFTTVTLKELTEKKADLERQLVELNAFIKETELLK